MATSIEDKIKKQSEKLAALKIQAKAVAKANAEKAKVEQLKNQIAVGEIVLSWRNSGYKMSPHELKAEIEKVFNTQSVTTQSVQSVNQNTDQADAVVADADVVE